MILRLAHRPGDEGIDLFANLEGFTNHLRSNFLFVKCRYSATLRDSSTDHHKRLNVS